MTKLLDFWAEWCIDPQTPVLTKDKYLPASQIKVGQNLVTIDPQTYQQAIKTVQKVRIIKNVPSKKIILETGRSLTGDNNHKVLTETGFKSLSELEIDEKILVNPIQISEFIPGNSRIIMETTGNQFADKILDQLRLLPLKDDNAKLMILARLLGFVMTDGYLYEDPKHNIYETHFIVGQEKDALAIKKDLRILGFEKLEIKKRINDRKINNRDFTITTLRCRSLNRSLFFLLKALGAPIGRKKNQAYFIPAWIMEGQLSIKKEFLSGWLGGDGCKIDYYIKHAGASSHLAGFKVNAFEFHKEKNLEREGILYAKQLGILLDALGVKVSKISSYDDEDGVIISLKVATDYDSLLNLAKIGYAYAGTKNSKNPFVREFLKYRLFEKLRYSQIKEYVLQQIAIGAASQTLAHQLQIPQGTIISWRYTNRETKRVNPPKSGQAIFTEWLTSRQQGELLWEKVIEIEEIENQDVIGITVDDPHTIITNGIVSHNCGPCRFMEPIMDELEKELAGKVQIEKINVDEKPDAAAKYGVMSIPTYIVLKDDKEVERIIGATSKDNLLKAITKNE